MQVLKSKINRLTHWIHHYLIWLVIGSYILAIIFPSLGLTLRKVEFANIQLFSTMPALIVSLPLLMLAVLLFNAGMAVNINELRNTWKQPKLLMSSLFLNSLTPLVFIVLISVFMLPWHNPKEIQQLLVGLAFIAAMPIAGASTAWTQNTNGNLALSLSLVLITTLLSPLFTPLVFHSVGVITTGSYSENLHDIASGKIVLFLGTWVIFPTLLGIFVGHLLQQKTVENIKSDLKFCNYVVLLLLNYINAATVLPNIVANPDIDFLVLILGITISFGVVMFSTGYYLAHYFKASRHNTLSLMFCFGMSNNGIALTLASIVLADHPDIMIPIIFYNLIQHLMASFVDRFNRSLTYI